MTTVESLTNCSIFGTAAIAALGLSKAAHEFLVLHYFATDSIVYWNAFLRELLPNLQRGSHHVAENPCGAIPQKNASSHLERFLLLTDGPAFWVGKETFLQHGQSLAKNIKCLNTRVLGWQLCRTINSTSEKRLSERKSHALKLQQGAPTKAMAHVFRIFPGPGACPQRNQERENQMCCWCHCLPPVFFRLFGLCLFVTRKHFSSQFATIHLVLADRRATARTTTFVEPCSIQTKKTLLAPRPFSACIRISATQ